MQINRRNRIRFVFVLGVLLVSLSGCTKPFATSPFFQSKMLGDPYHPGLVAEWAADWREAWAAAVPLHPDERTRLKYLEDVSIQLYRRLKQDELWAALASLADNPLAHETLESEQVEDIVRESLG